jgi:xanthine dehydrogenase accessory factor
MDKVTEFYERVAALGREGRSFAVATVVARRPPVSAHLGDRAVVFADGRMEGFVGGACAREIVRQQALDVLRGRRARLVSIRPDASDTGAPTPDLVVVPMTCASEGAVDVYVEPFVRVRTLVVVGATPVAEALVQVARAMRYNVMRVVDASEERDLGPESADAGVPVATLDRLDDVLQDVCADDTSDCAAVVASQGHYDEVALERILRSRVTYVGLVASRRRGDTVHALLRESGTPGLDRLRSPAGLDLGARTAPEVAVSILGEIVQVNTSGAPRADGVPGPGPISAAPSPPAAAIDPVCGMRVDIASARHTAELEGVVYYFCCPNCRARFVRKPQAYLTGAS